MVEFAHSKVPLIEGWQANVSLAELNTLGVPARAQYYVEVVSESELLTAVSHAKQYQLPIHILGGGSNVLCQPQLDGVVIRPLIKGKIFNPSNDDSVIAVIGAGENWHGLVETSLQAGYYGLENLALIPGLVGAAPIQNIGAYGVELSDFLIAVRWFDCDTLEFETYSAEQCQLGYRDSLFKGILKSRAIITQVTLKLSNKPAINIKYAPLQQAFLDKPATPEAIFETVCGLRKAKLPQPEEIPNAGSFFKNPIISSEAFSVLQKRFPNMPFYPQITDGQTQSVKVPAGWLIDQAGLKGQDLAGLYVHQQQALVLTNPNKLDLSAVNQAAAMIMHKVESMFEIALEVEPQLL